MKPRFALLPLLALSACSFAPAYHVPQTQPIPAGFKAAPGWVPAQPADAVAKGEWWRLFDDPVLDDLAARVVVTNQNVAAARAAYDQARAIVAEQRAALFPVVSANANATRSGSFGDAKTATGTNGTITSTGNRFGVQIGASWEPDLWGKLRNGVSQASANAEASAADLANATLAARGELATDYLQLRGIDAQKDMLAQTVSDYSRALQITTNRYNAGTVAHGDVYQAQTQLDNARASLTDLDRQRTQLEDAIAVLAGENPSAFRIAPAPWKPVIPEVPGVVPSTILQRRPDIAGAERRVAAANAGIGIQRAAFFPDLTLNGSTSSSSSALGGLFAASTSFWSLGGALAETLLDFGARSARVRQARAVYEQAVATYRQTVLAAFQQVEDNLGAVGSYGAQMLDLSSAADAATRAEAIARNQYLAGIADYTTVITASTAALSARQKLIQTVVARQTAAVALVQAIGGEWTGGIELHPDTRR